MNTIARIRKDGRVAIVDDERAIGNGVIITLRKGFSFDPLQDNRVAGEDTASKARGLLAMARPFGGPFDL